MSGAPKRGMVAGQAITTQAQTKEFDEGFDRIFGTVRNKQRGRFVYRDGQMVSVDEDWTDATSRAQTATEELTYARLKATDGTDISSRKKHREYLKANGLCQASDYSKEYQEKAAASRERAEDKARHEMVERNAYKVFGG